MHRAGGGGRDAVHLPEVARTGRSNQVIGGDLSHGLGPVEEQFLTVVSGFPHLLQPTFMLNLALCSREAGWGERVESIVRPAANDMHSDGHPNQASDQTHDPPPVHITNIE